MTTLGLITIGQSPRTDLTPEFGAVMPQASLREYGALDGLTPTAIARMQPTEGQSTLTSRLHDGTAAVIAHDQTVPLIAAAIARAEQDSVDLNLLLCSGSFPSISHERPLFRTEQLAHDGVRSLLTGIPECRLGIVRPLRAQVDEAYDQWAEAVGREPIIVDAASPYTDTQATINRVAADVARNADLVVLDCIGFSESMRQAAHQAVAGTGAYVVTVRSLAARILSTLT